jgi:hypothetical protein
MRAKRRLYKPQSIISLFINTSTNISLTLCLRTLERSGGTHFLNPLLYSCVRPFMLSSSDLETY